MNTNSVSRSIERDFSSPLNYSVSNSEEIGKERFILRPTEIRVESINMRFIHKVMYVIETHISNPIFCMDILSDELSMSNIQVYRKLKMLTERTPNELIRNIRLERAASLLAQQADHVSEIAHQVGFNNLSYFSKCFKEKYKLSPSKYTRQFNTPSPTLKMYHELKDLC